MSTLIAKPTNVADADLGDSRVRQRWLNVDAMMSGGSGLALLIGAPVLGEPLGAATWLVAALGLFFLAYAGVLVALVRRGAVRREVIAVAFANTAWVALSVVIVAADTLTLTRVGTIFAITQAVAVMLVADLQLLSVRGRHRTKLS